MFSEIPQEIKKQIEDGIVILKEGGVIAFPTDTVYGLGAAFDNISAVERVFRIKKRQDNKGLPMLVADRQQMAEVAGFVPPLAEKLLQGFKTGSITLVLKKAEVVPDVVTGGKDTLAVRITANPVAQALIKGLGKPVVATSVNISGESSALTAKEARSCLGDKIDMVIEDISGNEGLESTIVDISGNLPKVLREGVISKKDVEKVCQMKQGG